MSFRHQERLSLLFLGLMLCLTASLAIAAPGDENWDSRFNHPIRTHGVVSHLAVADNNLYVAGKFIQAGGILATNIAKWDGTNWSSFPPSVMQYTAALHAKGTNLYLTGELGLDRWNGESWVRLHDSVYSYFNSDPTTPYQSGICTVSAESKWNNQYDFSIVFFEGTNRTVLARTSGIVYNLTAFEHKLYAFGFFDSLNGLAITNLAQWDGTNWSQVGPGLHLHPSRVDSTYRLRCDESGLYIAGAFHNLNGLSLTNIARWDGSQWSAVGSGLDFSAAGRVYSLEVNSGNIYALGLFGPEQPGKWKLAHWNGSRWTFVPAKAAPTQVIVADAGGVYLGGDFGTIGGTPVNGFGYWNGKEWAGVAGGVLNHGSVDVLAIHGNDVVVGGNFQTIGGISATNLARWDGTNWFNIGGADAPVTALASAGASLYAGGAFNRIGNHDAPGVAQWDGTNWGPLGNEQAFQVTTFALLGTNLFATGFTFDESRLFGFPTDHKGDGVWRWAGTNWHLSLGLATGWRARVNGLGASSHGLYTVGIFSPYDPAEPNTHYDSTNGLKWEQTHWAPFRSDVVPSSAAIAADNDFVYVSGSGPVWPPQFSMSAPAGRYWMPRSAYYIKWFNGTNWTQSGLGFAGNPIVLPMHGNVFLGSEDDYRGIIKWDGISQTDLGSGIPGGVRALAFKGNDLLVGGKFSEAGGKPSEGFAVWHEPAPEKKLGIHKQEISYPRARMNMLLFWPRTMTNAVLDECNALADTNWNAIAHSPGIAGSHFIVTNSWALDDNGPPPPPGAPGSETTPGTNKFFRLREVR